MEDTANKFCATLFDVLLSKGVKDIVCSPGSRNVPLLLAASAREDMKKHFAVDERSAGFMALGLSLVKQNPVAIVCTSGTALLNYAPAVAEAFYQGIPLIVISADRPIQWIDQDDSQTLRQYGALDNFIKKSYDIPAFGQELKEMNWYVNRISNDAVITAVSGKKGPVHINVQLSEPLDKTSKFHEVTPRIIEILTSDNFANKETYKHLAHKISESKVLLVAGFSQPDARLQKAVVEFSRFGNVAVMAETISNIHFNHDAYSIDYTLTAFNNEILDKLAPDVIISFGGALVSRKLKEYLRRNSGRSQHWSIGYNDNTADPFFSLSIRVETEPFRFLKAISVTLKKMPLNPSVSNYNLLWKKLRQDAFTLKSPFIEAAPWSELKAFDYILKSLPSDYNLFLSNGTPVRYAQLINYNLPHASFCNRGVSGIDGSVSTAVGGAMAYKGKTLLITGDLSLSYDIGALSLLNIPDSFKIIVIDNQGGGIFRFIPSTSSLSILEEYLCQKPVLPLLQLAEGYGWEYYEASDEESLRDTFQSFLNKSRKAILKITCPGALSASVLSDFMKLKYP